MQPRKKDLTKGAFALILAQGPLLRRMSTLHWRPRAARAMSSGDDSPNYEESFVPRGTWLFGPVRRRRGIILYFKTSCRRRIFRASVCGSRGGSFGIVHIFFIELHRRHNTCKLSKVAAPPVAWVWTWSKHRSYWEPHHAQQLLYAASARFL